MIYLNVLTKNDLQQIKLIVDTSIDSKLEVRLKPIKKQLSKVQKDLDTVVVHFDKRLTKAEKDVKILQNN